MLLVSGFRPIQKNYNNQNTNFKQPQFQIKGDSVNFTSTVSKVAMDAELRVQLLTQGILTKYGDVLGENFQQAFLSPFDRFLTQHGINVHYNDLCIWNYPTGKNTTGEVKKVSEAYLVDSFGRKLDIKMHGGVGITENEANLRLFDNLVKWIGPDDEQRCYYGPLSQANLSPTLKTIAQRILQALDEYGKSWENIEYNDQNLKLARLQVAFKELMPGKLARSESKTP